MSGNKTIVRIASLCDIKHIRTIIKEIESSAKIRETGINKRSPEVLIRKISEEEAVIAVTANDQWAGFGYLQTWDNGKFVSYCGLIVSPGFRKVGIARAIKVKLVDLSQLKYPLASIFGLTT